MKKVFIGLLIIAAGAGVFFLPDRQNQPLFKVSELSKDTLLFKSGDSITLLFTRPGTIH